MHDLVALHSAAAAHAVQQTRDSACSR